MTKTKSQEQELFTDSPGEEASTPKVKTRRSRKIEINEPQSKGELVPLPPPNMLAVLHAAAQNKNVDPAKMRELWALYLETEAKQQFHDALLKIDFPAIDRDGRIPIEGKKALRFASFENVHRAVTPLLKAHGFRMSFQPMPGPNGEGLVVECRLIRGTYEEKCVVPISTASASRAMNSQQASGAAISYGKRYGMIALLNLRSEAPEDRDTDGTAPKEQKRATINGSQAKELLKAINESGLKLERFLEKYGIKAHHDLPAQSFDEAMKALKNYKAKADASQPKG